MTFIVSETYELGPSPNLWPGHIAVASAMPPDGGVAMFSGWILRDDFASANADEFVSLFFDQAPIRGRSALGHRGTDSPCFEFLEDGVGGAIHEVGHLFGLTHHKRGRPNHIMASGFRQLRHNVAALSGKPYSKDLLASFSDENADLMMQSRFVSNDVDRDDDTQPQLDLSITRKGKRIEVSADCRDDRRLSRIVVVEVTEKAGRQLVGYRKIDGRSAEVNMLVEPFRPLGPSSRFQVIVVDRGGNFRNVKAAIQP